MTVHKLKDQVTYGYFPTTGQLAGYTHPVTPTHHTAREQQEEQRRAWWCAAGAQSHHHACCSRMTHTLSTCTNPFSLRDAVKGKGRQHSCTPDEIASHARVQPSACSTQSRAWILASESSVTKSRSALMMQLHIKRHLLALSLSLSQKRALASCIPPSTVVASCADTLRAAAHIACPASPCLGSQALPKKTTCLRTSMDRRLAA